MLGVSTNTLGKWVRRGRLSVIRDLSTDRELIDIEAFVPLLVKVRDLRAAGTSDGLVAAAIASLERADPKYQTRFSELYGPSLEAVTAEQLKPVVIPETFGTED